MPSKRVGDFPVLTWNKILSRSRGAVAVRDAAPAAAPAAKY